MKLIPLLMILVIAPANALAGGPCKRLPVDPEFPAGLSGSYELIGKDPSTGASYVGSLAIGYGKSTYALTRTLQGTSIHGDAWIERCGIDKVMVLAARYYTKPVTEVSCALDADGDNSYRATCKTRQGGRTWRGLEAWFQRL